MPVGVEWRWQLRVIAFHRCMLRELACTRRIPLKTNATQEKQSGWPYLYRETFRSEFNSAHRTLSRSKHRGVSTPVAGPVSGSLLMLKRIYTLASDRATLFSSTW